MRKIELGEHGVTDEPTKDREFVTALARGLSVIQAFDRDNSELTLSDVVRITGLSPGTARRCLWTLQSLGYVGSHGRRFLLRPKVLALGSSYLDSAHVDELVLPYLRELVTVTGESSSLAVLDGPNVLHLANFSAKRLIRLTVGVGTRFPAFATSVGRVLLSDLPTETLQAYLKSVELKAITPRTVTDPAKLRRILAKIREDGYAMVTDELEQGLTSIAVPVKVDGRVIAAINCSTFHRRDLAAKTLEEWLQAIREASLNIADAIRRSPVLLHSIVGPERRTMEAGKKR